MPREENIPFPVRHNPGCKVSRAPQRFASNDTRDMDGTWGGPGD